MGSCYCYNNLGPKKTKVTVMEEDLDEILKNLFFLLLSKIPTQQIIMDLMQELKYLR